MVSALRRSGLPILVTLLVLSSFQSTNASSAAALVPDETADSAKRDDRCLSSREEDRILCQASRLKEASLNQVIAEDETTGLEPEAPSGDRDVWKAAYDQWIVGDKRKRKSRAVNRAIEEAKKKLSDSKHLEKAPEDDVQLPEGGDDELTVITAAARAVSKSDTNSGELLGAIRTIEELCYSGDNGKQMQATGGVSHLLRLANSETKEAALLSIKALATCSQNNPQVFDAAVAENAIPMLLKLAERDETPLRAACLRALLALSDAEKASDAFSEHRDSVVAVVRSGITGGTGVDKRRCKIRTLAFVEQFLVKNRDQWRSIFWEAGLEECGKAALKSEDVDLREGAARMLQLLR